jgi:hypothetical protein
LPSNRDWPANSQVDQSGGGAICLKPPFWVTTNIRPKGLHGWQFLAQAWIAHQRGGVMPAWLPDPSPLSTTDTSMSVLPAAIRGGFAWGQ